MKHALYGALCGVVTLLVACSPRPPVAEPVRAVKLVQVTPSGAMPHTEYAADIRARTESRLAFRVGGQLLQRPAEVGQRVKAGQLLAVIDAQDYQLGAQAAGAQVLAAQTQRDLAVADLQRYESLRDQGFISSAEFDRRRTAVKAAQATLQQATAQADVQNHQSSYTRLLADADGVIVSTEAEPGQVLTAGAPVVRLARNGPRDAVFSVPEDHIAYVRTGQRAEIRLWLQGMKSPASVLNGQVREVAASADSATRTYSVKVALPSDASPPLGATATVQLQPLGHGAPQPAGPAVMALPTGALWQQGAGSAVWVFHPQTSTVQARKVEVSGVEGAQALISSGLQPGDEVVVAGTHVLQEGQKVTRYQPVVTKAAP